MKWPDIVILILLAIGVIQGFRKGFIIQLASLVAILLGMIGAGMLAEKIAPSIMDTLGVDSGSGKIIAFVFLFCVIVVSVLLLAKLLEVVVKVLLLGIVNRIVGAVFGLIKWFVIMSVFVALFERMYIFKYHQTSRYHDDTYIYSYCYNTGNFILNLL